MNSSVVVFNRSPLKARGGGPSSYLWNLREGMRKLDSGLTNLVEFVVPDESLRSRGARIGLRRNIARLAQRAFTVWPQVLWPLYGWQFRSRVATAVGTLVRSRREVFRLATVVHAHSVLDAYFLLKMGLTTPLILTSHAPEPLNRELQTIWRTRYGSAPRDLIDWICKVEREGFERAYALIYPSPESMEAHLTSMPWLAEVVERKRVYFVPTGVMPMIRSSSFIEVRQRLGIGETRIFVLYVGRYTSIKGFDLYLELFRRLRGGPFVFGSMGRGEIAVPNDPEFIDLGWVDDPSQVMSAADLLVMPARMCYFDLVGLEAMSIGLPILASAVGGNKTLARYSSGVVLFQTGDVDDAARSLLELSKAGRAGLQELGRANARAYRDEFSLGSFAKRYLDTIRNVLEDVRHIDRTKQM